MAGGNTYGVGAVTVHGGAKTDIIGLTLNKTATEQGFGSDGDRFQKRRWAEDNYVTGQVEAIDVDEMKALEPGDSGTIVMAFRKRSTGTGYSATVTATITNTVLGAVNLTVNHNGPSNATVPFTAHSSDGATSPIAYS